MRYKELYDELNKSGELYEVFDNMSGVWAEDKHNFIEQQLALQSLANNIDYDESE